MGLGTFAGAPLEKTLITIMALSALALVKTRFNKKSKTVSTRRKKAPGGAENGSGLNFNHKTSARRENSR